MIDRPLEFEYLYQVINELENLLGIKIKGNLRKIVEFIAKENLSESLPSLEDI